MANDAARIAENPSEQQQRQTPSGGEEQGLPEPLESEFNDCRFQAEHATNQVETRGTDGSIKEVQGEGKEDDNNELGKGKVHDLSAQESKGNAESVGEIQNFVETIVKQQEVLMGKNETILSEMAKVKGHMDDSIKSGKRGENDDTADYHTGDLAEGVIIRESQDLTEGVVQYLRHGKRETEGKRETMLSEMVKVKGHMDDSIETGERGENDETADYHTGDLAEGVIIRESQDLTEGVVQDLLHGERETESADRLRDKNSREIEGDGEDNDLSAGTKDTSNAESVIMGNHERSECAHQEEVRMGTREKIRSSETVMKDEGVEGTKPRGEANHSSADETARNETVKHDQEPKELKEILEGARGIKALTSSAVKKHGDNILESGKGESSDQSAQPSTSDAGIVKQDQKPSLYSTQKQVQRGNLGTRQREFGSAKRRLQRRYERDLNEGKFIVDVASVTEKLSEVEGGEEGRITKGAARKSESSPTPKVTEAKFAREPFNPERKKQKTARDPMKLPLRKRVRPGARPLATDATSKVDARTHINAQVIREPQEYFQPEGPSPPPDSVSGGAATTQNEARMLRQPQHYGLDMARRGILMRSTQPSYLGRRPPPPPPPPPPPYYHHFYHPPQHPGYFAPPYISHPLPHHHLHYPHPHALAYELERERQVLAHVAAAELPMQPRLPPSEFGSLRAVAEHRHRDPPTMVSSSAFQSYPSEEAKADAFRASPTARDPFIRSRPHMLAAGQGPPAFAPRTSGAMLETSPSVPIQRTSTSMPAARVFAARRAEIPKKKEWKIDIVSEDPVTLARVRRDRKNAQSRKRCAQVRIRVSEIQAKPRNERTVEEEQLLAAHEAKRLKKNSKSRKRAAGRKQEIERILALPKEARSTDDVKFLENYIRTKKRKVEGDKLRRDRVKQLGFSLKEKPPPGITARGPLPPEFQSVLDSGPSESDSKYARTKDAQSEEQLLKQSEKDHEECII